MLKTAVLLNIFVESVIIFIYNLFFRSLWWIESSKEQHLFEIEIIWNIKNAFTVILSPCRIICISFLLKRQISKPKLNINLFIFHSVGDVTKWHNVNLSTKTLWNQIRICDFGWLVIWESNFDFIIIILNSNNENNLSIVSRVKNGSHMQVNHMKENLWIYFLHKLTNCCYQAKSLVN